MATITDLFNPSFCTWPLQSNRTGLQPVNIPLVLVVPYSRDPDTGNGLADSQISNLKFFIEEAPGLVPVAGFEHEGIFVPDYLRFVREVSLFELVHVKIDLSAQTFFDKITGEVKTYAEAVDGDSFDYVLTRGIVAATGPRDRVKYVAGADYFDLSTFVISTAELKPYGRYKFSWQCNYFNRIITNNDELLCIDPTDTRLARFSMMFAHPGEIHQMMIERTPSVYFEGKPLDQDNLTLFYRPFADALQDLFDEQDLMVGINFIDKIPAQFIPYLSFLLGWDLPFFPGATDKVRRAVLRNGRHLQQLKGSKRVIRELFELFGFTIDVVNLWYRKDGKAFVGPGELQPAAYEDQEIQIQDVCQTEILMADYAVNGYGEVEIPLLFRPDEDITIDAWLVDNDSVTASQMQSLLDVIDADPEGLMAPVCTTTASGFLLSQPLQDAITGPIDGYSQILLTQKFGATDEVRVNDAPLSIHGATFDRDTNIIKLSFDHFIQFNNQKLFVFATYKRKKLIVPQKLTDLRSNRFDIRILFNRTTGEAPSSQLLDFMLDFIFKLKAFHSILRKIVYTTQVTDVYNTIDFCIGGKIAEAPGTDLGELQTVPPIIPAQPGQDVDPCSLGAINRGFKDSDFALRKEILKGLKEEHTAWKNLDGTRDISTGSDPLLESLSRIPTNVPDESPCQFTKYGQDRVIGQIGDTSGEEIKDFDHVTDDRTKLCDDTNNVLDNCFKGRVQQELRTTSILKLPETWRHHTCRLMMGYGFYFEFPIVNPPVEELQFGEGTFGQMVYGAHGIDTTKTSSFGLGQLTDDLIRVNAYPPRLEYTASPGLTDADLTPDRLAIRRPSLEIEKDNLFIPGHRFIAMNQLENDYTSATYSFRPWDSIFYDCEPTPGYTLEDLDLQIAVDSLGDEVLVFNEIPWKLFGNGLIPDASTCGTHEDRDYLVTHSIFSSAGAGLEYTDGRVIESDMTTFTSSTSLCLSAPLDPIFSSANRDCNCTGGEDYIDGYPAEYNRFTFDAGEIDYSYGGTDDIDLNLLLGLPVSGLGSGTAPADLLFKCGSGIRVAEPDPQARFYAPYRLDCGCSFFECTDGTGAGASIPAHQTRLESCETNLYRDEEGEWDPGQDHISADRLMLLLEKFGTSSIPLSRQPYTAAYGDVEIPNFLTFDPTKLTVEVSQDFPPSGDFFFIDQWGIIYEGQFETEGNRIDITLTTKDPRIPGEESQGLIRDGRVYRRGIITTQRFILETGGTKAIVIGSGSQQRIDLFQATFMCGDRQPVDPFAFHCDNGISDDIEIDIVCGPSWSGDWSELSSGSGSGSEPVITAVTPTGVQPFEWMNVWSNEEVINTICSNPTGSGSA